MRPRMFSILLPGLLLAACGGTPPAGDADRAGTDEGATAAPAAGVSASEESGDAHTADEDVIVSTNEPFWQARVEGDSIVLTGVDAPERRLSGASSSMTAGGRRIAASDAAGEVVVTVRRMRCEDDMSGAVFPMTGLLAIDGGAAIRGCARPATMPPPKPPEEG
ncbi:hypothetical protein LDO26_00395 [Luteimonas sp. BDR2-5]|uniref:hypothetical protein n=1 Tax=Proluteimonas luteida TaxID=2878685 RepID=UPI001E300D96|nr:hypothetical protein [Luteimonas sp. BDR2-5]MCD9026673.1 hypothetical protein [Luteimonas sp. BDR2-5]